MVAAVRVHKHGGPEALVFEDVQIPAPGQGQVKIKQHACGVNFIDCYFRMGMYPSPVGMPFIAGNESAGEVIAVGPGVTDLKVGDRVGFVGPLGGYAAERLMPADRAVKLPDNISYEQAAGMMLKGMTVQYLVNRTYKVGKGTICLIHAAGGGVDEADGTLADLVGAVDQILHGHALEHHAGGLFVTDVVGQLHRPVGRHQALGRVTAERSHETDAVAHFQIGHARTDRDYVAGDERHADRRRVHAHAEIAVDEIDAARMLLDLDLALPGRRDLHVLEDQSFGTAVFVNAHCRDHSFTPSIDLVCCVDGFRRRS